MNTTQTIIVFEQRPTYQLYSEEQLKTVLETRFNTKVDDISITDKLVTIQVNHKINKEFSRRRGTMGFENFMTKIIQEDFSVIGECNN